MSELDEWNNKIIEEFRANGGKVGKRMLLLLHTTGSKSGKQRVNPLGYIMDGERFLIIASNEGGPTNPDWYHNIIANPLVAIEVGAEQFQVRATIAAEPERTRLYNQVTEVMPNYAEYQRGTTRVIPVVILTRVK